MIVMGQEDMDFLLLWLFCILTENLPPISKRKRGEEELPEGIAEKVS